MIVAGAESAEHRLPAVGAAIAIGIAQEDEICAVAKETASAIGEGFKARWNHQAVSHDCGSFTVTIVIAVFQNQDPVVRLLARLNLGINTASRHPQSPACV